MREAESPAGLVGEYFETAGKAVIEIGCGTGELARALTIAGARVVAIDRIEMLTKACAAPRAGGENYVAASGESLPFADGWADAVLCIASLHHLPSSRLDVALAECARVLKRGACLIVVEPLQRCGSYGDLTFLEADEIEAQKLAYDAILRAVGDGFEMVAEEPFFVARSFADFEQLIETFVEDPGARPQILARARTITAERASADGIRFDDYRYRSFCRMNVLRRKG